MPYVDRIARARTTQAHIKKALAAERIRIRRECASRWRRRDPRWSTGDDDRVKTIE